MTTYDLVRAREKKIGEQMKKEFRDHKAQYRPNFDVDPFGSIERVVWKKLNTCIYQVNYLAAHGCVFISGDLGHGVFRNGYTTPWELVHSDFHYLSSKIETIDNGDRQRDIHYWEQDLLCDQMKIWLKDKETPEQIRKAVKDDWESWTSDQREWRDFLYRNEYSADLGELHDFGEILHPRIIGWLCGIAMAYEQLHPKEKEADAKKS